MNIGTCCFFSQLAVGDRFALTQRCMLLVDPFLESSFGYPCVSVCNDSNGAPARVGVDSLIPSWWLGGFRICGFQKQSWCVVLKTLLRFQSLLVMFSFTFQVIRSCKCRETTTYLWNLLVILGYIPIRWWRHTYTYHIHIMTYLLLITYLFLTFEYWFSFESPRTERPKTPLSRPLCWSRPRFRWPQVGLECLQVAHLGSQHFRGRSLAEPFPHHFLTILP